MGQRTVARWARRSLIVVVLIAVAGIGLPELASSARPTGQYSCRMTARAVAGGQRSFVATVGNVRLNSRGFRGVLRDHGSRLNVNGNLVRPMRGTARHASAYRGTVRLNEFDDGLSIGKIQGRTITKLKRNQKYQLVITFRGRFLRGDETGTTFSGRVVGQQR